VLRIKDSRVLMANGGESMPLVLTVWGLTSRTYSGSLHCEPTLQGIRAKV
jgi:hypothetical protein